MNKLVEAVRAYGQLTDEECQTLEEALKKLEPFLLRADECVGANQIKVLAAFQKAGVGDFHLHGSTGYGYGDAGRAVLEAVWADIFKAEKALVRSYMLSGTHAIAGALFGNLHAGDTLLSISGEPYDTLQTIIGTPEKPNTLRGQGVSHEVIELTEQGFDHQRIKERLQQTPIKMVAIQRSRGYAWRASLNIQTIAEVIATIRTVAPETIVFVDNCYGEFVEDKEPLEVGADLIAGSLIKNPGGALAPRGGYIAGKEALVKAAAERLAAPGISEDVGSALDFNRLAFQGLFMAPLIVTQALKGAIFSAYWLEKYGYVVHPTYDAERTDIIQAIQFGEAERLRRFCEGIQSASPLESYVKPVDAPLPGYDDAVIMAGGTFVQGSSIELSIDGPMRPPYIGYMQGGLSFAHVVAAVVVATRKMEE